MEKQQKKHTETEEEKNKALYIAAVERELTEAMNTKVSIRSTGKSKGRIEIEYYSEEDLERLLALLKR